VKTVNIDLGERSYEIRIAQGLLGDSNELLPWIAGSQAVIITDEVVAPLYLDKVSSSLSGKKVFEIILPDGENTKTLHMTERLFDELLKIPCDRNVTLLALGGGVIGDIVGFTAACYQRGVAFIQIPTTLLSQVDSSVGGKTAVNHPIGKNMIGAFYQPRRVISDIKTLSTLDTREFSSGMSEVIKYGLINDLAFFEWIEANIDAIMNKHVEALEYLVERSCLNKARIIELDEKEGGVRALLNLGHTFGHAIETGMGYGRWLHGEAIAIGIVMAADMSKKLGWLGGEEVERIKTLLSCAQLSVEPFSGIDRDKIIDLMRRDKKVQDGNIKLILMRAIGQAEIVDNYCEAALHSTLEHYTSSS